MSVFLIKRLKECLQVPIKIVIFASALHLAFVLMVAAMVPKKSNGNLALQLLWLMRN